MPRRPPSDERLIQKVVRLGHLMDIYGTLLTEKQRMFMRLHYQDDLSFGEIAADHGVSRQAIHDAVKHAEKALEEYERKLGLFAKRGATGTGAAAIDALEALTKRVKASGVIYNTDWIQSELQRISDLLRGTPDEHSHEEDIA
jgi:predicted DNA-binding protein YlxM (UPF0122 family)